MPGKQWDEYVEASKVSDQKWREQEVAWEAYQAARVAYDATVDAFNAAAAQCAEKRDALGIAPAETFRGKLIAV
jgi:hypothetical protein